MKKQRMMVKRSEADWRLLFAAQELSGMRPIEFCKANRLCNKHFSVRRQQLGWRGVLLEAQSVSRSVSEVVHAPILPGGEFVRVLPAKQQADAGNEATGTRLAIGSAAAGSGKLRYGGCEVVLESILAVWLVEVLRGLSA